MQPTPPTPADWRATPAAQWAAIVFGALPLYAIAIYGGFAGHGITEQLPEARVAVAATIVEVALFGGLMLACLLVLNGQSLRDLNLRPGTLLLDIPMGFGAFSLLLAAVVTVGVVMQAAGASTVPEQNLEFGRMLAKDSQLAAAMFGPVIWLKAAVLEEFSRVFMLSRLWRAYPRHGAQAAALVGTSLLFGLGHMWQGWYGVGVTAVIGLVLGWVYWRFGRVLPLILAHGIYDTLAMLALWAMGKGLIPTPGG